MSYLVVKYNIFLILHPGRLEQQFAVNTVVRIRFITISGSLAQDATCPGSFPAEVLTFKKEQEILLQVSKSLGVFLRPGPSSTINCKSKINDRFTALSMINKRTFTYTSTSIYKNSAEPLNTKVYIEMKLDGLVKCADQNKIRPSFLIVKL